VSPGQTEHARNDLRLARQALRVAGLALDVGALEDAASRCYYAMFHAARAALTVQGLSAKTHSGLIQLFERTYGPSAILGRLFQMRGEADYSAEAFTRSRASLESALAEAKRLVERCDGIVSEVSSAGPDSEDAPPDL
jgi:uncharacterized protein (UPF0332 family)